MKTKHRILSVLTVLALLASLTAVMVAPAGATVPPEVTASPTAGHVGSVVTLTGTGFTPGAHIVSVTFDGVAVTTAPALPVRVGPIADPLVAPGVLPAISFTVPASPRGARTIVVSDGARFDEVTFTVEPRVTLSLPHTGPAGATRTATVTGFTAGRSIDVFAGATRIGGAVTDATGGATVPVTMIAMGTITAQDGAGHWSTHTPPPAPAGTFRFAAHTFGFIPGITLDPTSGTAGASVDVRGTGFTAMVAGATVAITVGLVPVAVIAPITVAEADADAFTRRIVIPAGLTPGPKTVVVTVAGEPLPAPTAVFTVAPRVLTLTPASGPVGTVVAISGSGFPVGRPGNVTASPAGVIVALGVHFTTTPAGAIPPGVTATILTGALVGLSTFTATVDDVTAVATFTVLPAAITVSPASGPPGTVVTISGTGFPHGVAGHLTGPPLVIARVDFHTTPAGAIPAGMTATILPGAPAGVATLTVTVGVVPPVITASTTFTVAAPAITISPTSGAAGTVVTVSGVGFVPFGTLADLRIIPPLPLSPAIVTPTPTVITDAMGNFTTTFVVPGLPVAPHPVTAMVGGVTSPAAMFTITAVPAIVTVEAGLAAVWPTLRESVWEFRDGVWLQYFIARPELVPAAVRLTRLERGRAYWVFLAAPIVNVHLGGMTRTLPAGWHNIGWH